MENENDFYNEEEDSIEKFFEYLLDYLPKIAEFSKNTQHYTAQIGDYEIDTCLTYDCGWETGIRHKGNPWVIVGYYPNEEKAKAGHVLWSAVCQSNPTQAFSVQTKRYESLIEEE